jgi:hypothetical protein
LLVSLIIGILVGVILQIIFFYIQLSVTGLRGWLMLPLMLSSVCIMTLGMLKGGAREPLYKSFNSWSTDEVISSNAFVQGIPIPMDVTNK